MMRAVLKTTNPDEIEFTLTVTMSLKDWKELREAVDGKTWPASRLHEQISDMVIHATKHFWPAEEAKP